MRKSRMSMLLAVVLIVAGLIGCSSNTQAPSKETAKPADKQQNAPAPAPEKPKGSKFAFWDNSEYVKDYNEIQKALKKINGKQAEAFFSHKRTYILKPEKIKLLFFCRNFAA